ncbi:hypothetical protein QFC24_006944 [Naganishia onofrii]|uniref:Uncharacterized protein n=1 Tax=Naganishia onofrii TaxID=1851511 RepID=A0ACC2WWH7_9TREE|nr:hypothetical protein QFC24_006944 [Naganishia onofrii]
MALDRRTTDFNKSFYTPRDLPVELTRKVTELNDALDRLEAFGRHAPKRRPGYAIVDDFVNPMRPSLMMENFKGDRDIKKLSAAVQGFKDAIAKKVKNDSVKVGCYNTSITGSEADKLVNRWEYFAGWLAREDAPPGTPTAAALRATLQEVEKRTNELAEIVGEMVKAQK